MLKKISPVAFCGVLCFSSVVGLVNAGSWQETLTVPAGFEKVDYVDSGKLFWLQRPKEKHPKQFMNLSGKVVTLPDGTERGGTKDDLGIPTIYNGADNFPGNSNYSVVQFALSGKRSSQGLMDLETGKTIMPLGEYKDLTVYRDGYVTTGNWEKMSIYKNGQLLKADLKKAGRYYPLKDSDYCWHFNITLDELIEIAEGRQRHLSLWSCGALDCQNKEDHDDFTCLLHDYTDDGTGESGLVKNIHKLSVKEMLDMAYGPKK